MRIPRVFEPSRNPPQLRVVHATLGLMLSFLQDLELQAIE